MTPEHRSYFLRILFGHVQCVFVVCLEIGVMPDSGVPSQQPSGCSLLYSTQSSDSCALWCLVAQFVRYLCAAVVQINRFVYKSNLMLIRPDFSAQVFSFGCKWK